MFIEILLGMLVLAFCIRFAIRKKPISFALSLATIGQVLSGFGALLVVLGVLSTLSEPNVSLNLNALSRFLTCVLLFGYFHYYKKKRLSSFASSTPQK